MAAQADERGGPEDAKVVPFPATQNPANRPAPSPPAEEGESLSLGALIGIGTFLAALVIAGLWLMDTLRDLGKVQDCAMQGRRNCAEIATPARDR